VALSEIERLMHACKATPAAIGWTFW